MRSISTLPTITDGSNSIGSTRLSCLIRLELVMNVVLRLMVFTVMLFAVGQFLKVLPVVKLSLFCHLILMSLEPELTLGHMHSTKTRHHQIKRVLVGPVFLLGLLALAALTQLENASEPVDFREVSSNSKVLKVEERVEEDDFVVKEVLLVKEFMSFMDTIVMFSPGEAEPILRMPKEQVMCAEIGKKSTHPPNLCSTEWTGETSFSAQTPPTRK
ncbi:hypothetical protein Tco_1570243 [Tanacetum coccineum]